MVGNRWDFARFGENLIWFDMISLDPVKISLDPAVILPDLEIFVKKMYSKLVGLSF